jgi:GH15 family glucan-1,4-alpha-glucosidase
MSDIEDYALIGDCRSAALVGLDGSIDWLCLPRFDAPAVFAALVGERGNGRWKIAPAATDATAARQYVPGTLVLQTTFTTPTGSARLTDAMVLVRDQPQLMRRVEGLRGRVDMHLDYIVRFDYGSIVPWVRRVDGGLDAIAGSNGLLLTCNVDLRAEGFATVADFTVDAGARFDFVLTHYDSFRERPEVALDTAAIEETAAAWHAWSERCTYTGPFRDEVVRSLITLRALTYEPTGGIVAAPTTSLPERLGGVRNWDYRYCWLRDATFTLESLMAAGFNEVAAAWRNWLVRAVAGEPSDLQIVYDIRGNRRLPEIELPWLAGYQGARPVRIGNDAHGQFQLDVYGEVIDMLFTACRYGMTPSEDDWALFAAIVNDVEKRWKMPDRGLWEIRGDPQHFTHSKVMAWVALDRAVKSVEHFANDGPLERWRGVRDEIFADVCAQAFDAHRNTFVQAYGSQALDASLLLMPLVGFLPIGDSRIVGTIAAIERELLRDGVVYRYSETTASAIDGLPPGEGAFLACSFWLVDNYVLAGRHADATAFFERLIALRNDVGLLSEEYDPGSRRLLGNFPQAFSHVGLINSALHLGMPSDPSRV